MRYLLYAQQKLCLPNLRPLQREIFARGGEAAWLLTESTISADCLRAGELRLPDAAAAVDWRPDAVLVPGNMVPAFLPGIKTALFHGFNVAKVTRSDERGHFNIRGCFDLYCTQGPNTTGPFRELMNKHRHFSVQETGWPALDPLFDGLDPVDEDRRPCVILCSTFNRDLSCAPHLLETVERLSRSSRWRWLVQFHPKMDKSISEAYKALQNENLSFIETDDVIPYLRRADVMVCDTSSVMYMFMAKRRPVVTFRNRSRGARDHLIDIDDPDDLEAAIGLALARPESLLLKIDAWIAQIHPYSDGRSSGRVLDAVEAFHANPPALKAKPLNLLRNLKQRSMLGYWGTGARR
jgi:CDP-glycerol glycerophosphotransferase (TagB/SpsB family)